MRKIISEKRWWDLNWNIRTRSLTRMCVCVCVCRCFCGFDVHVLMNCRYKETALRGWNYGTNCRQGYLTRRKTSRGALDVIAFLLFGFARLFSRLRAHSNCAPIIFQLVSRRGPITERLRRNKSAFRETNPNIKAWEHLFSGRFRGLGNAAAVVLDIRSLSVNLMRALWALLERRDEATPLARSMASFSTYSTSCVSFYLRGDLVALLLERDSAQLRKGKMLHGLVFRGRKQAGRAERGKNCSHSKIICDGLWHFPTYLVTPGPCTAALFFSSGYYWSFFALEFPLVTIAQTLSRLFL